MRIPTITGTIDRRILVNFRIAPEVAGRYLPPPFLPKLAGDWAIGGVCLIRFKHLRPRLFPEWVGMTSENAAHRFAVEWDESGRPRTGVYIPRRDTDSRWNAFVGGRLFPGTHHRADFTVDEEDDRFEVEYRTHDSRMHVAVRGQLAAQLPHGSVFGSLGDASEFFELGSVGYSATADAGRFDGVELRCRNWRVEPLAIEKAESTFFEDTSVFPQGSVEFDCALLMRGIDHEWHGMRDLRHTMSPCDATSSSPSSSAPASPANRP